MESIRDLFESFRSYLRDRLANPLYVSFVIAWGVLNFRLLMVVFGDGGWKEKIEFIDTQLYPDLLGWAWRWVGSPFLVAVLFVLASPFIHRWVTVFLREREKVTVAELLRIAGETPMPPEAADVLRTQLLEMRKARAEDRRRADEQINELNAQIELLQSRAVSEKPNTTAEAVESQETDAILQAMKDPFAETLSDGRKVHSASSKLQLFDRDFSGLPSQVVNRLLDSGLRIEQAWVLFIMRDGSPFTKNEINNHFSWSPSAFDRVLEQMTALQLLEVIDHTGAFQISSAGRQALNGVVRRGFDPTTFA